MSGGPSAWLLSASQLRLHALTLIWGWGDGGHGSGSGGRKEGVSGFSRETQELSVVSYFTLIRRPLLTFPWGLFSQGDESDSAKASSAS